MDKDSSRTVTFRLTEPILCAADVRSECVVVVELVNPDPTKLALDNCIVKWTQNEWHQQRDLKSKPPCRCI
jgi:hypothetical protein